MLSAVLWTLYGVISVFRYIKSGDQFLLWTGIFIGLGHFFIFIRLVSRTAKKEIKRKDISSIKLKNKFGNKFLDIKLHNGKLRRVSRISDHADELKEYIEADLSSKNLS